MTSNHTRQCITVNCNDYNRLVIIGWSAHSHENMFCYCWVLKRLFIQNLLSSKNFDDSRSTVSEDFQDSRPPSAINLNRQIMTTRKAAWLLVKNILIHSKKGKVELASHRKWKKYWVTLKGVELVFYHANEHTVTTDDLDEASYRLGIDCCIAQPVPEYARLENVFSLSTKHGNAYYFQVKSFWFLTFNIFQSSVTFLYPL